MRILLALCAGLVLASPLAAQPSPALEKAFGARNEAVRTGSGKEWAKYATDDYSMMLPNGAVMTKQQRVAEIDGHPIAMPEPRDLRWREYGDAAIETSQMAPQGKPARLIVVWVKRRKEWKVAAAQWTPISSP